MTYKKTLTRILKYLSILLLIACLLFWLKGCFEFKEETVPLSMTAYNHTDNGIPLILINGEGGVLGAGAHSQGGGVCCVVLPVKWRPGLKAKIDWELSGDWLRDENGKEVIRDGKRVYVEGVRKTQTVEIPKYDEEMGDFYMHFFPGNVVKVLVSPRGPAGPENPIHPYNYPEDEVQGH